MEDKNCVHAIRDNIQILGQLLLLVALIIIASGCSKRYGDMPTFMPINLGNPENYGVGTFKTSYIADQIDFYYRGTSTGPIGVTTIVNLNELYGTSAFGRVFSEQMISELVMRGYDVVELRQSDALQFVSDTGEFVLSRDPGTVRKSYDLAAVLAGTYVASADRVYVNVRLIDPSTSVILSSGSVELAKTYEVAKLLRGGSMPSSLERIPVKHMAQQTYPLTLFQAKYVTPYDQEELGYGSQNRGAQSPKVLDSWDISKRNNKESNEKSGSRTQVEPPAALK
ncbi:MAG: FlgO family outer membrane protein [bacterium]|nr:FlgO family outer membrane protein [bacterium]